MYKFILLCIGCICLLAGGAVAQEIESGASDDSGILEEAIISEDDASSILILDNTRTKLGRDFYEAFYQQWSAGTTAVQKDSTNKSGDALEDIFTITIDELPTPGLTSQVSIRINDLLVWQELVQPRIGSAQLQAEGAAGLVREYITNYQEIQAQLGSEDQQGTGIY